MKTARGFTLVELLAVLAILSITITLSFPSLERMFERSRSAACAGNLRSIGVSVQSYLSDHDQIFPYVLSDPTKPVDAPGYEDAKGMLETFSDYGVTPGVLRCPADVASVNYFAQKGTSYEWRLHLDGEEVSDPTIYRRRRHAAAGSGTEVDIKLNRFRLVQDFSGVHSRRMNQLFANGSVRAN